MKNIKNIVLDFGHGGIDKNGNYTTAPAKMFKFPNGELAYEGQLNRLIGGHLYTNLRTHNELNIVTTVAEDDPRDLSLSYRVRVANSLPVKETLFVSIHCNASASHRGTGFEIFTSRGTTSSDYLAEDIADSVEDLYEHIGLNLRYDFSDGDKDKEADFYVLKKTKGTAVLIECGFFDNYDDYKHLKSPEFQCALAQRIYRGILKYINS